MFNILILCTGNSARSVLAEAVFARLAPNHISAFSAGSQPVGKVNPFALQALQQAGYPQREYRSKSWDEFTHASAPRLDLIITVCSNAANEVCPIFQAEGQQPGKAHWPYPDPAAVEGSDAEKLAAFSHTLQQIEARAARLLQSLEQSGLDTLDRAALTRLAQECV